MDQPRSRLPARDRHLERVDDELGAEVVAHRPANDAAREAVNDGGKVEPTGRRTLALGVRADRRDLSHAGRVS
jgi:hypothetical protein